MPKARAMRIPQMRGRTVTATLPADNCLARPSKTHDAIGKYRRVYRGLDRDRKRSGCAPVEALPNPRTRLASTPLAASSHAVHLARHRRNSSLESSTGVCRLRASLLERINRHPLAGVQPTRASADRIFVSAVSIRGPAPAARTPSATSATLLFPTNADISDRHKFICNLYTVLRRPAGAKPHACAVERPGAMCLPSMTKR